MTASAGKQAQLPGSALPSAPRPTGSSGTAAAPTTAASSGASGSTKPDNAVALDQTTKSQAVATKLPGSEATLPGMQSEGGTADSMAVEPTVVAELVTAKVVHGDSLWRISRAMLGHGVRYTQIYAANTQQIRDPRLIYPGQVFVLPQQ
jgi:nucleoid-associated protein YgaU